MGYYEILGINKNASQKDIRKAWHKLCSKWHPDKAFECKKGKGKNECKKETYEKTFTFCSPDCEEFQKTIDAKIREINDAYETLSNPKKREEYDGVGSSNNSHQSTNSNEPLASESFKKEEKEEIEKEAKRWKKHFDFDGELKYNVHTKLDAFKQLYFDTLAKANDLFKLKTERDVVNKRVSIVENFRDEAAFLWKNGSFVPKPDSTSYSQSEDSKSSENYRPESKNWEYQEKKTYRDQSFICSYNHCYKWVDITDNIDEFVDKKTGKKYCSIDCFKEWEKEENKRLNDRLKEQSDFEKKIKLLNEEGKDKILKERKGWTLNSLASDLKFYNLPEDYHYFQLAKEKINDSVDLSEVQSHHNYYSKIISEEGKKLWEIKIVEIWLSNDSSKENQLNQKLGVDDWRLLIKNCSNVREAKIKADSFISQIRQFSNEKLINSEVADITQKSNSLKQRKEQVSSKNGLAILGFFAVFALGLGLIVYIAARFTNKTNIEDSAESE